MCTDQKAACFCTVLSPRLTQIVSLVYGWGTPDAGHTSSEGWRMVPRKTWSRKILAGSRNLGSVFDKSRSLVFAWLVFTFFESRNFLPKSLGLGFLTRISASRILPFATPHLRTAMNQLTFWLLGPGELIVTNSCGGKRTTKES